MQHIDGQKVGHEQNQLGACKIVPINCIGCLTRVCGHRCVARRLPLISKTQPKTAEKAERANARENALLGLGGGRFDPVKRPINNFFNLFLLRVGK